VKMRKRDTGDGDQEDLKRVDCVKVTKGSYLGYFALLTGDGYGEEIETNYCECKNK